ncbi:MAG: site-specific integrase [Candidatus Aenigmarchaeota archaeon]|nr:site-specific integrase [Candidatus Aenigmarchaeota archaeon]
MKLEEAYFKKIVERKLEKIKNDSNINQKSKEVFLKFVEFKQTERISYHRLSRVLDLFYHILKNFKDLDFSTLTQEQADKIWIWISQQDWKEWTKYTYSRIFKNFVGWLNENYGLKIKTKDWKVQKPKNSIMPEYLITKEEFNKLFNATDDIQERLLIGLLYESGSRIGEILSLKIKNVSFNNYGAKLIVKWKTGQRVIPIVWFANLLRQFIEAHPFKDNPEAFLFYYKNSKGQIVPMSYPVFRMRLKRLCKKVGINKRIHPHLFRHTRLTELAKELPEQILKQIAGWVPDYKMAQTYLHLSMRDVEESLLTKVYGIKTSDNEKKEKFVVCPKCGELNPPNATICWRCKTDLKESKLIEKVLSEEEMKKLEDWSDVLVEFFKRLEKANPQLWQILRDVLKEKGKEHLLIG